MLPIRFKIQEDGYSNGVWGTSKVINNAGKHPIKIPDCLPDGQYLLRAEMIALHAASSPQGAQLYVRLLTEAQSRDVVFKGLANMLLDGMRTNQHLGRLSKGDARHLQHSRHL